MDVERRYVHREDISVDELKLNQLSVCVRVYVCVILSVCLSVTQGYRVRRSYIATQGPLADTTEDFWRMLWEHSSNIVVMLCALRDTVTGRVSTVVVVVVAAGSVVGHRAGVHALLGPLLNVDCVHT